MARVLKEMAVVVATYEDRNTGQQKNRYRNIGVLMESETNGECYQYLLIDRTFNPAGVPAKAGSDKVLISLFDPRERNDTGQPREAASGNGQANSNNFQAPQDHHRGDDRGSYGAGERPVEHDSEIPF